MKSISQEPDPEGIQLSKQQAPLVPLLRDFPDVTLAFASFHNEDHSCSIELDSNVFGRNEGARRCKQRNKPSTVDIADLARRKEVLKTLHFVNLFARQTCHRTAPVAKPKNHLASFRTGILLSGLQLQEPVHNDAETLRIEVQKVSPLPTKILKVNSSHIM